MPKRKKMKDYGNRIDANIEENFLNKWSHHKETKEDLLMASYLLKAEGGSLIQILIADDPLYNGIFHLTKFKFIEKDGTNLVVNKFDDIHDAKRQEMMDLIEQLPEILEKYQGELLEDIQDKKNNISAWIKELNKENEKEDQKHKLHNELNPLTTYKELPLLILG